MLNFALTSVHSFFVTALNLGESCHPIVLALLRLFEVNQSSSLSKVDN
jgi:hypothetical protein